MNAVFSFIRMQLSDPSTCSSVKELAIEHQHIDLSLLVAAHSAITPTPPIDIEV